MPSDQETPVISQPKVYEKPTIADAMSGLQKGDSPLDFIRKNLGQPLVTVPAPVVPPVVPEPQKAAPVVSPIAPKEEAPIFDFEKKDEPVPAGDAKKADSAPAGDAADKPATEDEAGDTIPEGAQHFKNLRLKLKENQTNLKTVTAEKEQLAVELDKYKKGETTPEVLQQKETRIAELEHYEKIHNLKSSPAYQEKFVKPLAQNQAKLKEIAKDYGIPENVLEDAIGIENRADLNRFLSGHFDDVGALEVKELITQTKELRASAGEAEKAPAEMLKTMEAEQAKIGAAQEEQRKSKIGSASRGGWIDALTKIRKEGRVPELIRKENDPAYNEKYVDPILNQAGQEYGKFVTALAKAGLKEMPEEVSRVLAEAVLLAHATAVALPTRDAAMREAEEITKNTRYNQLIRPNVGGGVSAPSAAPRKAEETPAEAARNQINSILLKKQR